VKLDKLAKQARRDLAANPKKAAILGLMLLVAAYFWGPLVWKWVAPAGKKGGKEGQTALILEDDPAETVPQAKTGAARPFRWEKVRQLIRSDRLMVPAAFERAWPNPFAPSPGAVKPVSAPGGEVPAVPAGTAAQTAVAEITPQAVGLKLTSVAIGPRRRSATISGHTYREGDTIVLKGADKQAAISAEFRLVRVEAHGVEVQREAKTWWLEFEKPSLADGDEIEPATEDEGK
jgi:hypothetical protein